MGNSFTLALSTLIGTTVGAGIFGLPYVISRSGIIPGLFYFFFLGGAVMLLHLLLGEVCLRTTEKHRLIGYSEMYLGGLGKFFIILSTFLGTIGALLVYVILGGNFLAIALSPFFSISDATASFLFWIVLSFFVLQKIQLIAKAEFCMNIVLLLLGVLIFAVAFPHIKSANFLAMDARNIFLPYGVVLFSLVGWSAIPEIADLLKRSKEKRTLDNLIIWAFGIVIALYVAFSLTVVGVSGQATSRNALDGLIPFVGQSIGVLGSLFGLAAIASSFLILGNYLKNSLRYDFHIPYLFSGPIAIAVPFLIFLLWIRDVITVMGLVGTVVGVLEGAVIILLYQKAKKKGARTPEYNLHVPQPLLFLLMAILIVGALAEIFTSVMV